MPLCVPATGDATRRSFVRVAFGPGLGATFSCAYHILVSAGLFGHRSHGHGSWRATDHAVVTTVRSGVGQWTVLRQPSQVDLRFMKVDSCFVG